MNKKLVFAIAILGTVASTAAAAPVQLEAVLSPTDQIRLDFKDGSDHFVLMVRREGSAEGTGILDGAKVVEHGWHDIQPPHGADPQGYLELTAANGDIAYLKWTVRAVFVKGQERPRLLDYGHWELVSGTGRFADMRGVGTVVIKAESPTDRRFILEGEIGKRP